MVAALIDPPDWLLDAYRSRRCIGVAELYELRRLHDTDPEAAQALLAQPDPITRATMQVQRHERSTVEPPSNAPRANKQHSRAAPLPPAAPVSPSVLLRRAELLCAELDAAVAQLRAIAPNDLPALRARITAIAAA
jgi:ParB family chromosome partitioning protein